jgi:hypothetical protein
MAMVGGWEQLDPLGEGGQGTVYRARSPKVSDSMMSSRTLMSTCSANFYGAWCRIV